MENEPKKKIVLAPYEDDHILIEIGEKYKKEKEESRIEIEKELKKMEDSIIDANDAISQSENRIKELKEKPNQFSEKQIEHEQDNIFIFKKVIQDYINKKKELKNDFSENILGDAKNSEFIDQIRKEISDFKEELFSFQGSLLDRSEEEQNN
jgi:hypothetical protein